MAAENGAHAGGMSPQTVLVVLAGGRGSRFTDIGHKLLARRTSSSPSLVTVAIRTALEGEVGPVVVVTGALDETALRDDPETAALLDEPAVHVAHNSAWADGQSTSLLAGLDAARHMGADAVVVGLADQPLITAEAWRRVANGLGPISVATYDGRRGNPVRLHADMWGLLPTSGDEGARVVMRSRPDLVIEVPCSGSPADIDTVEDLHRWQSN